MSRLKQPTWENAFIDGLGDCEIMYERYIDMHRYYVRKNGVRVLGEADYNINEALVDAVNKMKKKLKIPVNQPLTNKNEKSFKKFDKKCHPFKKSS